MAMSRQEMLDDLIVSIGKDKSKREEIERALKAAGIDVEKSARTAFALLELSVESFRKHGISPCMLAPLMQLKAHGATSDRILKMLMEVQNDQELMEDGAKGRVM